MREMNEQIEFDVLLDEVLREVANAEPGEGFEARMELRMEAEMGSRMYVAGSPEADGLSGSQSGEGITAFTSGMQQGFFFSLWSNVRALFFPPKLPPLVLESRPIAVVDRMAAEGNYHSTGYAVAAHILAVVLIGFVVNAQIRMGSAARGKEIVLVEQRVAPRISAMAGRSGGGGGQPGPAPVSKGALPKFAEQQIVPPKTPPLEEPKIRIEPTIEVQKDVKMASDLPQLGMPNSPVVGISSLGNGLGTGVGSGNGPGLGTGSGGGTGGGPLRVGGGVTEPVVIHAVEPEFSEQARKARFDGNVLVYLWVDERGNPSHVRIARGVGMGLDEKALEAVEQYRFRPAMENGRPVMVEMYVEVGFHILF